MPRLPGDVDSERLYQAFMTQAAKDDPERFKDVCDRNPVEALTEAQTKARQERVTHLSEAVLNNYSSDGLDHGRIPTDAWIEPDQHRDQYKQRKPSRRGPKPGRPKGDPIAQAERKRQYNLDRMRSIRMLSKTRIPDVIARV